jgi:hypothetical protein
MSHIDRIARGVLFAGVLCAAGVGRAQDVAPINDRPNPYRTVAPWGEPPGGRSWVR